MDGTIAIRAAMEKQKISYQDIADRIKNITGDYISRSTIYRLLDTNDVYDNPDMICLVESVVSKRTQWQRLFDHLKSGKSITAYECFSKLGFTQLHARLKEIYKHTGYRLVEDPNYAEPDDGFIEFRIPEGKVIYWRKEGEGRSKYNRYYLPEYTPK